MRSQNEALRSLVVDAEAVTGQAAARSRELGAPGRVALDDAAHDRRARRRRSTRRSSACPRRSERARETLGRLADLAVEARPLARSARRVGPRPGGHASARLGPFLDDAEATMDAVAPTLHAGREPADARACRRCARRRARVLTAPLDIAAAVGAVLDALLGEPSCSGRCSRPTATATARRPTTTSASARSGSRTAPGRLRGQRPRPRASCARRPCSPARLRAADRARLPARGGRAPARRRRRRTTAARGPATAAATSARSGPADGDDSADGGGRLRRPTTAATRSATTLGPAGDEVDEILDGSTGSSTACSTQADGGRTASRRTSTRPRTSSTS